MVDHVSETHPSEIDELGARVLFSLTGSAGFGHLSRGIAMASAVRAVDPSALPFLLTEVRDVRLAAASNIPCFPLPPFISLRENGPTGPWSALPSDLRTMLWQEIVAKFVHVFAPDICVYDTYILDPIKSVVVETGAKQVAVLRKSKWTRLFLGGKDDRLYRDLDLIIVPHAYTDEARITLAGFPEEKILYAGEIIRKTWSTLRPDDLRVMYGITSTVFTVVATNGGGNQRQQDNFNECIIEAARIIGKATESVSIILITGPLVPSNSSPRRTPSNLIVREYEENLTDLMAAANAVVCRGGYNTINEVIDIRIPTIAIAVPNTFDDQEARILRAREESSIQLGTMDPGRIAESLLRMYSDDWWNYEAQNQSRDDMGLKRKLKIAQTILSLVIT